MMTNDHNVLYNALTCMNPLMSAQGTLIMEALAADVTRVRRRRGVRLVHMPREVLAHLARVRAQVA